jgi:hypothetical protein
VENALQSHLLRVDQRSDTWGYTLMDFALWGYQHGGHDTGYVQQILVRYGARSPPCGRLHTSAWKKPTRRPELYKAFSAAFDGCLWCVRQSLDSGEVSVTDRSDTRRYTLMDWAIWGELHGGNHTTGVQQLLIRMTGPEVPVTDTLQTCGQLHDRACRDTGSEPRDRLFSAAFAGCRACVQGYIQQGVHPAVTSWNGRYNAADWAIFGEAAGHGTRFVRGYLAGLGVFPISCEDF